MTHYEVGKAPIDLHELNSGDSWTRLDGQIVKVCFTRSARKIVTNYINMIRPPVLKSSVSSKPTNG